MGEAVKAKRIRREPAKPQTRTVRNAATVDLRREYADGSSAAKEIARRNVNAVRAAIFGLRSVDKQEELEASPGASSGEKHGLDPDPFIRLEKEGRVVPPPFDMLTLAVMPENNTELSPAIEAMSVNCEWFGWRTESRVPVTDRTPIEILRTLAEERVAAENFFENAFQDEDSLEEFRDKLRKDLEATGNFYVEFVEVPGTGELDSLNHLPAWMVRITRPDDEPTEYVDMRLEKLVRFREEMPEVEDDEEDEGEEGEDRPNLRLVGDEDVEQAEDGRRRVYKQEPQPILVEEVSFEIREQTRFKRFRRYVQVREKKQVWFKEHGDPRLISAKDGKVVSREDLEREHDDGDVRLRFTLDGDRLRILRGTVGFPVAWAANPVRHKRLYSTRSPYGLPRYVGHLFAIFGSRAAEEINYATFKNNNIPSAVITVTNGQLTDESVDRLEEFVEAAIASDDNYSKFLLLEGEPVMEGMRDPGSMKIEIKPLTAEQHTDALFVNYKTTNDDSVRRAWRFPPIFVGKSDDFTGKTIEASRKLADEQVFSVERKRMDDFFTKDVFIRYLALAWSTFRSNSPNVTENADLLRALVNGEKIGSMTPQIGRDILSTIMNRDLGRVDPEKLDPHKPFTQSLAETMKAKAPASGGGEANSQGRTGGNAPSDGQRDRDAEPGFDESAEENVERLAAMLRDEVGVRFGGFVPPVYEDEGDDE